MDRKTFFKRFANTAFPADHTNHVLNIAVLILIFQKTFRTHLTRTVVRVLASGTLFFGTAFLFSEVFFICHDNSLLYVFLLRQ